MERMAIFGTLPALGMQKPVSAADDTAEDLSITLKEAEMRYILKVYDSTGKNKTKTAQILDVSRLTLRKKLEEYGIRDAD